MKSYRDLDVWKKAIRLVDYVYSAVRRFPREQMFVLSQQMRSAALSIPCNIAEGAGRGSHAEFRQFLRTARGSTLELQTRIIVARRQRFIDEARAQLLDTKAEEVGKMLNGMLRALSD